jgi:hypothetical protein
VEIVYTKFASLIQSDPIVQTMLPLTPAGEICDVDGNCVDPDEDELFKLTTKSGELTLEREKVSFLVGCESLVCVPWQLEEACEREVGGMSSTAHAEIGSTIVSLCLLSTDMCGTFCASAGADSHGRLRLGPDLRAGPSGDHRCAAAAVPQRDAAACAPGACPRSCPAVIWPTTSSPTGWQPCLLCDPVAAQVHTNASSSRHTCALHANGPHSHRLCPIVAGDAGTAISMVHCAMWCRSLWPASLQHG